MFTFPFSLFKKNTYTAIKSFLLDGVDEFIDFGTGAGVGDFDQTADFSVAIWVKADLSTGRVLICGEQNNNGAPGPVGWHLRYEANDKARFILASDSSNFCFSDTSTITTNTWTHIIGVFTSSGSTCKTYIDGVNDTSFFTQGTLGSIDSGESFKVGDSIWTGAGSLKGNASNIVLLDKAISVAEATELYNNGKPFNVKDRFSAKANITFWAKLGDDPLDDATGGTGVIKDQIASNDGTPNNTEAGDIVNDTP